MKHSRLLDGGTFKTKHLIILLTDKFQRNFFGNKTSDEHLKENFGEKKLKGKRKYELKRKSGIKVFLKRM
jgi:hypothetical protein